MKRKQPEFDAIIPRNKDFAEQLPSIFAKRDLPPDFPIQLKFIPTSTFEPLRQLHYHNCFEIAHCLDGHGFFVIDNQILSFERDDIFFLGDFSPHFPQAFHGASSVWETLFLNPSGMAATLPADYQLLETRSLESSRCNANLYPDDHEAVLSLVSLIVAALRDQPQYYKSEVRGLVTALMVRLNRFAERREIGRSEAGARSYALDRIRPVIYYIAKHYNEAIDLGEVCWNHGFSRSSLQSLFRKALNKSPSAFIKEIRMTVALRLLRMTSKPIIEISADVGYPTISNFNRCFKTFYGHSPKQARGVGGPDS